MSSYSFPYCWCCPTPHIAVILNAALSWVILYGHTLQYCRVCVKVQGSIYVCRLTIISYQGVGFSKETVVNKIWHNEENTRLYYILLIACVLWYIVLYLFSVLFLWGQPVASKNKHVNFKLGWSCGVIYAAVRLTAWFDFTEPSHPPPASSISWDQNTPLRPACTISRQLNTWPNIDWRLLLPFATG